MKNKVIDPGVKPEEKFIKFKDATKEHGTLKILIEIYSKNAAINKAHTILSTITITEEETFGKDKEYGFMYYPTVISEKQVKEAFGNIIANPLKFKSENL